MKLRTFQITTSDSEIFLSGWRIQPKRTAKSVRESANRGVIARADDFRPTIFKNPQTAFADPIQRTSIA